MKPRAMRCVVDASVAIKLFVEEPLSDRAELLFSQLASDPDSRLYVPDLFFVECANILWKYSQRFGYPPAEARKSLSRLNSLALDRIPLAEILPDALDIALAHSITVYDACYVAAALLLNIPMVTADRRLVRKLASTPHRIVWLGDFDTPSSGRPVT
ncbi:MAG: type II toxin-antitoxin system VapC family toxin [bacterium]